VRDLGKKKKKKFSLCDVGFGILDLKLKLERKVIKWLAGFFFFFFGDKLHFILYSLLLYFI
jgi:hypothetical protein